VADQHKNFAVSSVATAPSPASTGTSLVVVAGDGAKFPTPPFNATVWPANKQPLTSNAEIVRVTGVSTDALTIQRAQESTSAVSITAGYQIAATVTAKTLTDIEGGISATRTVTATVGPPGTGSDYTAYGTDDHLVINSALTAVGAAGGGRVLLRGWTTYDINGLVQIPDSTTLCGENQTAYLKANAAYVGTATMIINAGGTTGNSFVVLENLTIDGNQANRSGKVIQDSAGHNLIFKNCTYSRISNVYSMNGVVSNICLGPGTNNSVVENSIARNSWDHNILVLGNSTSNLSTYRNIIRNNVSYGAGQGAGQGVGIELATMATDNIVTGNISRNNLEGGVQMYNLSSRNQIIGNHSYSNGQNGVTCVDGSDFNVIVGNLIKDCSQAGISCTSSGNNPSITWGGQHLVIGNNTILNCGWNGIRGTATGDLNGSTITGNIIDSCGALGSGNTTPGIRGTSLVAVVIANNRITSSYERSIRIDNASRVSIVGNYIADGGTGGGSSNHAIFIDTSATIFDCRISENQIYNTKGSGILIGRSATNLVISNNIIRSCTATNPGMNLRGMSYSTVTGNNVTGNTAQGIVLQNDVNTVACTYNVLSGNICTTNTSGGIVEQGNADYNTYLGNNLHGNTANNLVTVGANDEFGHNRET
jgi:parallel beta-helix repeat protein